MTLRRIGAVEEDFWLIFPRGTETAPYEKATLVPELHDQMTNEVPSDLLSRRIESLDTISFLETGVVVDILFKERKIIY